MKKIYIIKNIFNIFINYLTKIHIPMPKDKMAKLYISTLPMPLLPMQGQILCSAVCTLQLEPLT